MPETITQAEQYEIWQAEYEAQYEAKRAARRAEIADLWTVRCKCGERRYATVHDAYVAEPSGSYKCPTCHTFATDHPYVNNSYDEDRCGECDTRMHSHR